MHQEQQKYDSLLHELEQLRTENTRLKEILQANGIAYEVVTTNADEEKVYSDITFPDVHLGKDERVELFRSLFRGRAEGIDCGTRIKRFVRKFVTVPAKWAGRDSDC